MFGSAKIATKSDFSEFFINNPEYAKKLRLDVDGFGVPACVVFGSSSGAQFIDNGDACLVQESSSSYSILRSEDGHPAGNEKRKVAKKSRDFNIESGSFSEAGRVSSADSKESNYVSEMDDEFSKKPHERAPTLGDSGARAEKYEMPPSKTGSSFEIISGVKTSKGVEHKERRRISLVGITTGESDPKYHSDDELKTTTHKKHRYQKRRTSVNAVNERELIKEFTNTVKL